MGYFSSGTEGMDYEALWCDHCVHQEPEGGGGCPVWNLHLLHNYEEANNKDSFLHMLIPLSADGLANEQCRLFHPAGAARAEIEDLYRRIAVLEALSVDGGEF